MIKTVFGIAEQNLCSSNFLIADSNGALKSYLFMFIRQSFYDFL